VAAAAEPARAENELEHLLQIGDQVPLLRRGQGQAVKRIGDVLCECLQKLAHQEDGVDEEVVRVPPRFGAARERLVELARQLLQLVVAQSRAREPHGELLDELHHLHELACGGGRLALCVLGGLNGLLVVPDERPGQQVDCVIEAGDIRPGLVLCGSVGRLHGLLVVYLDRRAEVSSLIAGHGYCARLNAQPGDRRLERLQDSYAGVRAGQVNDIEAEGLHLPVLQHVSHDAEVAVLCERAPHVSGQREELHIPQQALELQAARKRKGGRGREAKATSPSRNAAATVEIARRTVCLVGMGTSFPPAAAVRTSRNSG
jgi:hypothetical protein